MDVENVVYIFVYDFANVVMKPEPKVWNIFVHLYNKKVLKYGEDGEQDVIFVNLVWVIVEVPLFNKYAAERTIYQYSLLFCKLAILKFHSATKRMLKALHQSLGGCI